MTQFCKGLFCKATSKAILDDARETLYECFDTAKQEAWSKICQDITISNNDAKAWQCIKNINGNYNPWLVPNRAEKDEELASEFAASTSRSNLPKIVCNTQHFPHKD